MVFGVYALAVLVSLLTLGKLSDHLGRRPVLLAALAVQAASQVVFTTADGVPALLTARVIQGLATGAALGAIGAGMLDIDRERGTYANAVSPGMGTAGGALVSALVVRYLPAPTHLIYFLLLGVFALQALGVALMRETVTPKPGALSSIANTISYLGMGLPAVIAGVLVVRGGGLIDTAYEYGAAVIVLAAVALAGLLRTPAEL